MVSGVWTWQSGVALVGYLEDMRTAVRDFRIFSSQVDNTQTK